jgi:predicted DNA-binding protein (MmcQ/YjbR family)
MRSERARECCITTENETECFPVGGDSLVFKVNGKIFALDILAGELAINQKCDPLFTLELRERSVLLLRVIIKKYWNTINLDVSVPDMFVYKLKFYLCIPNVQYFV